MMYPLPPQVDDEELWLPDSTSLKKLRLSRVGLMLALPYLCFAGFLMMTGGGFGAMLAALPTSLLFAWIAEGLLGGDISTGLLFFAIPINALLFYLIGAGISTMVIELDGKR